MNQPPQTQITVANAQDYRESYANSVQVRVSVWDFFLAFGLATPENQGQLAITNLQGIYLSPQQAKALWNVLGQNITQYEQTFGSIMLEPVPGAPGPVH